MKKVLIIMLCVTLIFACFAGCNEANKENDRDDDKEESVLDDDQKDTISDIFSKDEKTEDNDKKEKNDDDKNENENKDELNPSDIFVTYEKPLIITYDITSPEGTTQMVITTYDNLIRIDVAESVCVYNLNDDTAFMYHSSEFGTWTMNFTNMGMVENMDYLNYAVSHPETVTNLERTELDGREVIYAQMQYEGRMVEIWYSEEYKVIMQYQDGENYMHVTDIRDFTGGLDYFAQPDYINLGTYDLDGVTFNEYQDESET